MTDRAQPGAQGSTLRNIEIGEAAAHGVGGFIQPSNDPTLSAIRYADLDESQFNEFDATYSSSSLDVTIDAGEAFVKGWLATDDSHTVTLDSFTDNQVVVVSWDADAVYDDSIHNTREDADRVRVELESNLPSNLPYIPVWEFDTDGSGVTSAIDRRQTKPDASFNSLEAGALFTKNSSTIAFLSSDQTVDDGTLTKIELDDSFINQVSAYNSTDNNIVIPSDGTYTISGKFRTESDIEDEFRGEILINGNSDIVTQLSGVSMGRLSHLNFDPVELDLNEGDTIELHVRLGLSSTTGDIWGTSGDPLNGTYLRVRRC